MKINKFEPNRDTQRLLKKSLFNSQLDFEIFSVENLTVGDTFKKSDRPGYRKYAEFCYKFANGLDLSMIDGDNSNEMYIEEHGLTVTKSKTPRGFFYNFYITFAGKTVNIFTIEEFFTKNIINDCGRFIFRGAFYYFTNEIPKYILDTYFELKSEWENSRNKINQLIKRTRVDIAFDFDFKTFDYAKFIKKSVNSKTAIKAYNPNDEGLYTGIQYLPIRSNKGYGLRIYDKHRDTKEKRKEFWYGDSVNQYKNWNRIEYELYPPYSNQCSDDELFDGLSNILFGSKKLLDKKIIWQPKSDYSSKNNLKSYSKYAKNHGIKVGKGIRDLVHEFFMSPDIPLIEKVVFFGDSLEDAVNQTNEKLLIESIEKVTIEDAEQIEEYMKTEKGKRVFEFVKSFNK